MKNFYLNHDSNMDDFTSLLLMLLVPDIKLIGVGVTDADGYVEPGVSASRKLIDRFNQRGDKLEVAKSDSRAVHQFPEAWRVSAFSVDHFPILNEKGTVERSMLLTARLPWSLPVRLLTWPGPWKLTQASKTRSRNFTGWAGL